MLLKIITHGNIIESWILFFKVIMLETYCTILHHFRNNELEKGKDLLSKALEGGSDDPFLAIKLTPPISLILPFLEDKGQLNEFLASIHLRMEELPSSLQSRAFLARALIGKATLEGAPPIDLLDFFHPQIGLELFPLVFLQQDRAYKENYYSCLKSLWSEKGFFIGPPLYSMHEGPLPKLNPADHWMRHLTGTPNMGDAPYYAALFPSAQLSEVNIEKDPRFTVFSQKGLSIAFFQNSSYRLEPYWRGFHLIRGLFEGGSFSVQGRLHASVTYQEGVFQVNFTYPASCKDRDPETLMGFYIDREEVDFLINGKKSLSFSLGDTISFFGHGLEVRVSFTVPKGNARVSGQVIPCARPAKEDDEGSDWAVFLRPVAIEEDTAFTMSIQVLHALDS